MVLFNGVTVIVAVTGALVVLTAVNGAISPVPLAGKPMPGASMVQVKEVAVPLKLMAVVDEPLAIV